MATKPGTKAHSTRMILAELKFMHWDAMRRETNEHNKQLAPRVRRRNPRDEKTGRRLSIREGRRINSNNLVRSSPKALPYNHPAVLATPFRLSVFDRRVRRSPEALEVVNRVRAREARNAKRREAYAAARNS